MQYFLFVSTHITLRSDVHEKRGYQNRWKGGFSLFIVHTHFQNQKGVQCSANECFLRLTISWNSSSLSDKEFVQNFTPPDFQAKKFTPSFSPNFISFSKKKHKKWVKMEKFTPLARNFTLPPGLTGWTNSTSAPPFFLVILYQIITSSMFFDVFSPLPPFFYCFCLEFKIIFLPQISWGLPLLFTVIVCIDVVDVLRHNLTTSLLFYHSLSIITRSIVSNIFWPFPLISHFLSNYQN